ncbi:MAG: Hpt domain-containing protein [Pseudobacteriovorax sp.]|nr:Hpt domain-containing protein [Pseudobacteriovorax sp.]
MPRLFMILMVMLSSAAWAQSPLVIDENFGFEKIGLQGGLLEDTDSSHTIESVVSAFDAGNFNYEERKKVSLGFSTSTWWLTVELDNQSSSPMPIRLAHNYTATDYFDVWLLGNGRQILFHGKTGDVAERQLNAKDHRLPSFNVAIPPGKSRLFIAVNSRGAVSLDVEAHSVEHFSSKSVRDYAIILSCMTVIAIMGLYNFCIFLQLRKPIYLYYVFFALNFTMQTLGMVGMYRVMFDNYTFISNLGFVSQSVISLLAVYAFAYYFLELYRSKILGLACKLLAFVSMVNLAILSVNYAMGIKISILASFSLSIFCIASGVVRSLQGFRPAYFYTIAWVTVLAANLSRMLVLSGNMSPSLLVEFGVHFGLVFEAVLISLGLADKIRLREKADLARITNLNSTLEEESQKVRDLNEHLEERVEEQTREIKSIMQNIQLGIVVIEAQDLLITDTYSEAVKDIFEVREVGGSKPVELLFQSAKVSREVRDQIATIIETSLNEDPMIFEVNEHLLPLEVSYQYEVEKTFLFDWKPVVDNDDLVEKIIVTIKDVTSLKALEEESKKREEELLFIGEILGTSPRKFSQFMEASTNFIGDNKRIIQLNHELSNNSLKLLFINLHTIKGAARALNLNHLTPVVHEAEQKISEMMNKTMPVSRDLCLTEHRKVDELLTFYETLNSEKLGRHSGETVSLSQRLVDQLHRSNRELMSQVSVEKKLDLDELNVELENLTFVAAEDLFKEVLLDAEMLARDLDKDYPSIEIDAEGVRFSLDGQKLLRNAFVHIIRNSMDHGIEEPQVRKEMGKSAEGHIFVRLHVEDDNVLSIRYGDDGAGLNLAAIREIAVNKQVITEDTQTPPEELAELIFHSGFSTSRSVSDISGRGVGMSAIREYFQNHGGDATIEIFPEDRDGIPEGSVRFELVMQLPERYFINRRSNTPDVAA